MSPILETVSEFATEPLGGLRLRRAQDAHSFGDQFWGIRPVGETFLASTLNQQRGPIVTAHHRCRSGRTLRVAQRFYVRLLPRSDEAGRARENPGEPMPQVHPPG